MTTPQKKNAKGYSEDALDLMKRFNKEGDCFILDDDDMEKYFADNGLLDNILPDGNNEREEVATKLTTKKGITFYTYEAIDKRQVLWSEHPSTTWTTSKPSLKEIYEEIEDDSFGDVCKDTKYESEQIINVLVSFQQLERDKEALRVLNYMKKWLADWGSAGKKKNAVHKILAIEKDIAKYRSKVDNEDGKYDDDDISTFEDKIKNLQAESSKLQSKFKKQFPEFNLSYEVRKANGEDVDDEEEEEEEDVAPTLQKAATIDLIEEVKKRKEAKRDEIDDEDSGNDTSSLASEDSSSSGSSERKKRKRRKKERKKERKSKKVKRDDV